MKLFIQVYSRKLMLLKELLEGFRKLKQVNKDPAFRHYRERYLELILSVLSSLTLLDIIGSQFFDYLTNQPNLDNLLFIRCIFGILITANFSCYLYLSNRVPARWFVYPIFYFFTIFSPITTHFTGGTNSPYWLEIIFILVTWFMMIPFSYKRLGFHALALAVIYTGILSLSQPAGWTIHAEYASIYLVVFILGMMVAIFNNIFSADVYLSEQRIAKSEQRFRMFTQNSLDVVWTMDAKTGNITYISPSVFNLRGYHPDELIGKSLEDSLTPSSKGKVSELMEKAKGQIRQGNKENVLIGELEQYTKNGETVWIEVIANFMINEAGEILEVVGDSRNITERKKAEAALLKVQKQLEEESHKLQQENLRIQFESLKNQINPHFLFNSLNVLTSLIQLDPWLAEKFTEHMAKVYRYVLEHREEDLVQLKSEVDFIASYTFLLEIRFKDKLKVEFQIPNLSMDYYIPPLTAQLLIENAVKHNMFSKKQPLLIRLFVDDNECLNVVNNLQKREMHMESTRVGLVNIEKRIRLLTDRPVFFGEVNNQFIARIPLFKEKNCT